MKLSFRSRMLSTVMFACIICTSAAIFISSKKLDHNGTEALIDKSRAILSRLEVGAGYVADMQTLDGVIAEVVQKYPDGNLPDQQKLKILKSVPIFAAFKIGENGSDKESYKFRISSDQPRNKDNQANADELEVIRRFRSNPTLPEIVKITPDHKFIRVSRPVRISTERGCLICHGNPSKSPWKNGKDILGYAMEDMKDGDLRGTFTIISSLQPVEAAVTASTLDIILWATLITFIALSLGFLVIRKPFDQLNSMAFQLSNAAGDVASMSTEIASTSDTISAGATEQASALQETTSSMEQMSAMVSRNAESASKSQALSTDSLNKAERGKTVVQSMIQSMQNIDKSNTDIMSQVHDSNQKIEEIVKLIADIGDKTKVINDIVFQTKLLSFNASVEAARAGEHGKGFAVVAEEVGNLAQMSGNAATEINHMLESSIRKVEEIVGNTTSKVNLLVDAGKQEVETGISVANQCGEVLDEIVISANNLRQIIGEIADGSMEQSKGIQEINRAMLQLNEVTQQNANSSHDSANAADRLSDQADDLRASVLALMQTLSGDSSRSS